MGQNDYAHRQLTRVVSGAVDDAFNNHPDYLTPRGKRSAKGSIVKRVTGTVLSFAVQAAKGRISHPAVQEPALYQESAQVVVGATSAAGAGAVFVSPTPHCRIGKVTFKPSAEIVDQLLTQAVEIAALREAIRHRPRRERRKDAHSIIAARQEMTERLARITGISRACSPTEKGR